ncbi:MAG: hypothetical protein WC358_00410 [Ignavibacteria bacterium]
MFIFIAKFTFATNFQIDPKPELKAKETRNHLGLSVLYSDKGYGISGGYYKSISKSSDLFLNFSITGISDSREFEYFDYYGNSYIQDKVNRVFMIPLNIGIQHYIFKDEIENDFKPLINIGVTPALVLINPYDRSYFNAFGYSKAAFAFGGFAGIGTEFQQSKNLAFSLNLRYFYIPVLSGDVMSIKDSKMNDLGGINLVFGVNFLK